MSEAATTARGQCPRCGMPIPMFSRRGKPFACRACGASLSIDKVSKPTLFAATIPLLLVARRLPLLLVIGACALAMLFEWRLTPVHLAESD